MIFTAIVTLAATFSFGFSLGKKFITKGLTNRAFQLIQEGDVEMGNVFLRLLKDKEGFKL